MRFLAICAALSVVVTSSRIRCDARTDEGGGPAVEQSAVEGPTSDTLRIATFNIEDVRASDVAHPGHRRLRMIAGIIRVLDADIILLNEIAVGQSVTGEQVAASESVASAFVRSFLDQPGGKKYAVFQPLSNTGVHSGYDLDNNGMVSSVFAEPRQASWSGNPPAQTDADREFGNDSWGFGTFPGQYAMALLVREGLTIAHDDIRTYRTFPWSSMPDALRPSYTSGRPWYTDAEWNEMPLSSKTHAVVPVDIRQGRRLNLVISHPTPPAFDGPEERNKRRNHDEIRLLRAILDDAPFLVDDDGVPGGLSGDAPFVVMGDLNADPDEGSTINNPVKHYLLDDSRIVGGFVPTADSAGVARYPGLDPDDTSRFGLRVDYVLPSRHFQLLGGGMIRLDPSEAPSDHFPVFVDVVLTNHTLEGR